MLQRKKIKWDRTPGRNIVFREDTVMFLDALDIRAEQLGFKDRSKYIVAQLRKDPGLKKVIKELQGEQDGASKS